LKNLVLQGAGREELPIQIKLNQIQSDPKMLQKRLLGKSMEFEKQICKFGRILTLWKNKLRVFRTPSKKLPTKLKKNQLTSKIQKAEELTVEK